MIELTPQVKEFFGKRPREQRDFFEAPTCLDLDRNFKKLLTDNLVIHERSLIKLSQKLGDEVLGLYQGPVSGLDKWTDDSDGLNIGLVKNIRDNTAAVLAIGERNAIVACNGLMYAAKLTRDGGFAVVRPIREKYQDVLKNGYLAKLAQVNRTLPPLPKLQDEEPIYDVPEVISNVFFNGESAPTPCKGFFVRY